MPSTAKLRPISSIPEEEAESPSCNTPLAPITTTVRMFQMANQTGNAKKAGYAKSGLWIAPSFSFKRTLKQSDWKLNRTEGMETNRFLEMADIALGLKSQEPRKKTTKRISN